MDFPEFDDFEDIPDFTVEADTNEKQDTEPTATPAFASSEDESDRSEDTSVSVIGSEPLGEKASRSDNSNEVIGTVQEDVPETVRELSDDEVIASLEEMLAADEAVIQASSALMEAEYVIAQAEKEREESRLEFDQVQKERREAEALLNKIIAREQELRARAAQWQNRNWRLEDQKKQAQRAKEMAEQAVQVKYRNRLKSSSYKDLRKGKAWWEGAIAPDGQTFKILEKQYIGSMFLADAQRCILGDGMGTGKSVTTIAALDLVQSRRTLIIAQADITNNFDAEVRMWAPHRQVVNIKGWSKEQRNSMLTMLNEHGDNFILIINYEAWRKDLALVDRIISMGFDTVILDEGHNLKDTASIAYRGVKRILHDVNLCPKCQVVMPAMLDITGRPLKDTMRQCVECGWQGQSYGEGFNDDAQAHYYHVRSVKNVWFATGTVILNAPQDLYAALSLTDPTNFSNKNQFLRQYCIQDPYTGKWRFNSGGADYLFKHQLKGKYLSRTMEEMGVTLPPQFPVIHEIEFDKEAYAGQWDVIQQITNSAQIVMGGKSLPILAQIAIITRQRQANVWPGGISWEAEDETGIKRLYKVAEDLTESIKIDKAIEIISESIDRGERVVLFSQFKTALAELQHRLNGFETDAGRIVRSVRFDGDTDDATAAAIKKNFDKKFGEEAKWDVVLANYKVGGTGLNYTAAVRTIVLDEEWNPGKRDQAYARTRRIGQDQTTFVDVLRLSKTVDTWLARLIDEKEKMIGGFEASASDMQAQWLAAFTDGEMTA